MNNTGDEFIESMLVATVKGEVNWEPGDTELGEWLEASYGNFEKLYTFKDTESGSDVVYVSYQYYEGEVESDEFIKDGVSILLVDIAVGEIIHEITDEDVEDASLFEKLVRAIEAE